MYTMMVLKRETSGECLAFLFPSEKDKRHWHGNEDSLAVSRAGKCSSRRESFVPVIICRGRASAINVYREHKGRKNSTKTQLYSRYILKRYSALSRSLTHRYTFITYPHIRGEMRLLLPLPCFSLSDQAGAARRPQTFHLPESFSTAALRKFVQLSSGASERFLFFLSFFPFSVLPQLP